MMQLFTAATATTLTVWWDQPEHATRDAVYSVFLNDACCREVRRTHCTFEQLSPESVFRVRVCLGDEEIGTAEAATAAQSKRLDVTDFGAVGDGKALNTAALQAAFNACGPEEEVYIPSGTFLTGALKLHSHFRLYLDEGAVLLGTDDPQDYLPKIPSRFEGIEGVCYQSLLNLGEMDHASPPTCRDILIYGKGTICGGGQSLAMNIIEAERSRLKEYIASLGDRIREYENDSTIPGRARGRLINLSNCEHVRISGLTLSNGASWNVHMIYSRDIVTDHCVFRSEGVWNGDGWDPDSSENCTLFACTFHTGDDSVAIKSGKNPEGNRIGRPTRAIRVFDCKSESGLGIAIGSEMSGGVEDVRIWDCDLEHSLYGVQIKGTKKRGGYVRNISVRDCILSRFLCCAVLYNDDGEGSPFPPVFSSIRCERVHFTGWARNYWEQDLHAMPGIDLTGFDVPGYEAQDLAFVDCSMGRDASVSLRHCQRVTLDLSQTD